MRVSSVTMEPNLTTLTFHVGLAARDYHQLFFDYGLVVIGGVYNAYPDRNIPVALQMHNFRVRDQSGLIHLNGLLTARLEQREVENIRNPGNPASSCQADYAVAARKASFTRGRTRYASIQAPVAITITRTTIIGTTGITG
jgi:hypothetical protein